MTGTLGLLMQGAATLFQLEVFFWLILGMIVGLIFGALPGFSSGNTAAIMLPLTLGMSPTAAIIFIGGIYVGAQYGGGIPSILIGTPGTAGAIATVFDGYEMAKQGKADQALGLSLMASTSGTIIAGVIAIFIIQPIASIALSFGPAEMALLGVLGLMVISSIIGKDLRKGLLTAMFGLLVSCMGADPSLGHSRLNFGFLELYDGIPLTGVLLGMFAFPSVLNMISQGSISISDGQLAFGKKIMDGAKDCLLRPFLLIWSALVGLFVGIIPGAGIDIGSFMAYSHAKMFSKHPETFGKGNPEGVMAPEAANNGVSVGALVPAMCLGIPGGTTTAVMLAALTLHGVVIGPQIVQHHTGMVYALMLSALVCGILTFPMGYAFNKVAVKITNINVTFIIPAVFVLCIVGSYAGRKFAFDMFLCLIAGIIGLIIRKNAYPLPPFILAFILGPIIEQNFIRAIRISNGNLNTFIRSPITKVMWIIIILTLFLPILIRFLTYLKESHSKNKQTKTQ